MNLKQQNLIDSYLRNELSDADRSSFEHLIASDPAFRDEVRFEEHVKDGIGRYRKAELKARLDALEVSPGWLNVGQLGSNVVVKTIGGLITAGIIGTAGFFLLDTKTDKATNMEAASEGVVYHYPQEDHLPALVVPEMTKEAGEPEDKLLLAEDLTIEDKPADLSEAANIKEDLTREEFMPEVAVPGLNEVETEETTFSTDVEMPEVSSADEVNSGLEPLDVKTVTRRSDEIRYKYFDGKLYLYGDFKRQPYEILEINGPDERNIYVYHNSSYYRVNITDKVEELPQITNEKLIGELEILRNNKVSE